MIEQSSSRRGRPAGQFSYHKLCVLEYLQHHQQQYGKPFAGTNIDLSKALSESMATSARQVARYLQSLQNENIPGTETPRIDVYYQRRAGVTKRIVIVNDTRPLKLY